MLRENIKMKLIKAMKSKDESALSALRMITAAIKDKDIASRPSGNMNGISDTDILQLLRSMIKQRKESVALYEKGKREDLVAKEKAEIVLISSFLPTQMNEEDVKKAIQSIISETGASSMQDMGKVMGALRTKYAGQMDFGKASALIKGFFS